MYKSLPKQMVLQLKDLVQYQPGQVVSRTLVQNDRLSMTLFSFDQGEEISAHASGGDAMVTVLEGRGRESWACRCLPRGRKQSHGSLPMEDMRETLGSISKDSLSGFESTECSSYQRDVLLFPGELWARACLDPTHGRPAMTASWHAHRTNFQRSCKCGGCLPARSAC